MSLFDYPRINITGMLQLNPGTANNDDYAGAVTLPSTWPPPYAGQTLALVDSKLVQPRTYGLSDSDFIVWVQQAQTFDVTGQPGQTMQIIPSEWNYYGDMGSQVSSASVVGVQTGPADVYTAPDPSVPLTSILGSGSLQFTGGICDVNSEGSPPATQFFIDQLTLKNGDAIVIQGQPSKGACAWINFYRNVNLTADGGAGGYVYHVILKDTPGTIIDLPGFDDPRIKGVVFRYYLYRPLPATRSNLEIEKLYKQQKTNPAAVQFVATFAPLYDDEVILTAPVGRLLIKNETTIPTPAGSKNNGNNGMVALAPAVLAQRGNVISAEFAGTFPEYYHDGANPKYDFGAVSLIVDGNGTSATIDAVSYADTTAGDQRGWVFDFDISSNADAQKALGDPNATFRLVHATYGDVLAETDYYVTSNQQSIYAEQGAAGNSFLNQGSMEPTTIAVYHRGQPLSASTCPPVTVWQYRSIPMQSPGAAQKLSDSFKPGDALSVDTSQPGNFLFTFVVNDTSGQPPTEQYSTFMFPPYITNAPSISLRILPNEDYAQYYVDPSAPEPVANDKLTFDILYAAVLRTYYLLYPVMNFLPLNSEAAVVKAAPMILKVTDPALWMTTSYMPRTRDMSSSRRTLLQAWCRRQIS